MKERPPVIRVHRDELIVDSFAGGGGASLGIEWATGRSPDIAVNHNPEALAIHKANHPKCKHYCEDVYAVDPRRACGGKKVALAWFSPDCTFHSRARGGKPFRDRNKARRRRGLAWVVVKWAKAVRPRVIVLENVREFALWGPLLPDGTPDPARAGTSYEKWKKTILNLGYEVVELDLKACDYGAPTTRHRHYMVFRLRGDRSIVAPRPTHGPALVHKYRTAAECIDWSIPVKSIFDRKRPLVDATMQRIARGVWKFVIESADPFLIPLTHQGAHRAYSLGDPLPTVTAAHRGELALVSPTVVDPGVVAAFLAKHYGGPNGKQPAGSSLTAPMGTVTTQDHNALVTSHLVKFFGTSKDGAPVTEPMPTVTATGWHLGEVRAFLVKYFGTGGGASLHGPMPTVTTHDRFALVYVRGQAYVIADIGMRMLTPRELARAQGFPDSYIIDPKYKGKKLSKTAQVAAIGNSVCPPVAEALVRAQYLEAA